jgi:hypothetical protein
MFKYFGLALVLLAGMVIIPQASSEAKISIDTGHVSVDW